MYVAPTPSLLDPYHRSPVSRFLLSGSSPLVLALFFGLLVCVLLLLLARRPRTTVVDRVQSFASGSRAPRTENAAAVALRAATRNRYATGWWAQLERDLELARMTITPRGVVALSLGGTFAIFVLALLLSAPLLGLLGLTTPLIARAVIRRKVKAVRDEFADQFPGSLQVLASALRAGHSFIGALSVVVNDAAEPSKSEFQRVIADEQLGVPLDDALHVVVERMDSRELEQVALVAALQRETGGNTAEVLDRVTETIRERFELRRTVKTLTAQGRASRWVLTALPICLFLVITLINPGYMHVLYSSGFGKALLVLGAISITAGSFAIKRIVTIKV
jgi:tight adherence protein B